MGELMGAGHVVPTWVTATQAGRIVQIIVLQLDERWFATLRDGRARGRAVAAVPRWSRCHRAQPRVMKMLFHVGTTASCTRTTATAATASAWRSTATRHAVRGRGTRRTGVARPEWAPQVREVERRRAARTLHLSRDVDAAATAYGSRGQTRRRRRRRRRRANTVRGPNLGGLCFTIRDSSLLLPGSRIRCWIVDEEKRRHLRFFWRLISFFFTWMVWLIPLVAIRETDACSLTRKTD